MEGPLHLHMSTRFAFIPRSSSQSTTPTYPLILSRFSRPRRPNSLRRKLFVDHPKLIPDSISPSPNPSLQVDLGNEAGAADVAVRPDVVEDNWADRCTMDAQRWVTDDGALLNSGISVANTVARGTDGASSLIPRNSSVSKFAVSESGSAAVAVPVRNLKIASNLPPTMFGMGGLVLSGIAVLSVVRSLLTPRKNEVQYTLMEKEMMRRKIKAREERAASTKAGLDICEDHFSAGMRPELKRNEVLDAVRLAKPPNRPVEYASPGADEVAGFFDVKVEEIREMARTARESEHRRQSLVQSPSNSEERSLSQTQGGTELGIELFSQMNMARNSDQLQLICTDSEQNMPVEGVRLAPHDGPKTDNVGLHDEMADADGRVPPLTTVYDGVPCKVEAVEFVASNIDLADRGDTSPSLDFSDKKQNKENHGRRKPKIIRTVREAKVYLSNKHDRNAADTEAHMLPPVESEINSRTCNDDESISIEGIGSNRTSSSAGSSRETYSFMLNDSNVEGLISGDSGSVADASSDFSNLSKELRCPDEGRIHLGQRDASEFSSQETALSSMSENWIEKYSGEMKPILEKMGDGFRNSYMAAREKARECSNLPSDLTQLQISVGNAELEWMKDEKLREVVFQVRDNELAGRDPFYSMQAEDKQAFFKGLEKMVEKENKRLLNLHEYLHSNIENLDYGADGISIYDPIAKIVPRWKEPPVFTHTEFLNKTGEEKMTLAEGEEEKTLAAAKKSTEVKGRQPTYPQSHTKVSSSLPGSNWQNTCNKGSKKGNVVIEGSDGSVRTGKKSGKEYWQHTKKWSRGFLDSYSAETDPEIKSVMKDVGKDLDRWITEKEIQEAAEIRDKFLERNKQYVEKKLKKLRREVELFGPKAVVSKYREYAEEKEKDYLWWLDLPFVLCIELYSVEDGEQKVGFYSLEMAADLELKPKPHHVIAFEDPGDCKNLCYIIQAHMEMLQNGHAFVVPRPSKDAFREAKANGFGVTVIRKGEVKLNVDQTLEEVEEQITEVGSRIYHDKIMKEHSVDTSQLMAGVFGVSSKPKKRKTLKQTRKRFTKK